MIHIVINSLGRGGAERSAITLAEHLITENVAAELITLFPEDIEYRIPPSLEPHLMRLNARSIMEATRRLIRHLASRRPGTVFSLMPQANIVGLVSARCLGMRIVTSERTTPKIFYQSRLKRLIALSPHALADKAVFISEFARRNGLPNNLLGRRIARNSVILHNPIDTPVSPSEANHQRDQRREHLRLFERATDSGPLRFLIASRLVQGKGILETIDRIAHFVANRNVQLDIAGTGPLREPIERALASRGLEQKTRLLGHIDDMSPIYEGSDVVLLTSTSEGFGRVGFEAYLAGCLVIGLPANSFWDELVSSAPGWAKIVDFSLLDHGLRTLLAAAYTPAGDDIRALAEKLSIPSHTRKFLSIIEDPRLAMKPAALR